MATYVFSDVHAHAKELKRALSKINYTSDDVFYCLGDMIDRGSDALSTIEIVRSLPHVVVLQGNHEELCLNSFHSNDQAVWLHWMQNGGNQTYEAMMELEEQERCELLSYLAQLPRFALCEVQERSYVLSHAGIRPPDYPERLTKDELKWFMDSQDPNDLLWIRDEFWGTPTNLFDKQGMSVIAVAGHTPTMYLKDLAKKTNRPLINDQGQCQVVLCGSESESFSGVDKIALDTACAAGYPFGQVSILCLETGEIYCEPLAEDNHVL